VRWATRGGVHVDRAGCAWLIRRFIDPDAGFSFVDDSADVAQDAILFDMPGSSWPTTVRTAPSRRC